MEDFTEVELKIKEYIKNNIFFIKNEEYNDQALQSYSNSFSAFISSLNNVQGYNAYFFSLLGLHSFVYKFYSQDNKIWDLKAETSDSFINFFLIKFGSSVEYKQDNYWEYYSHNGVFRKEGKNVRNKEGRYLLERETIDISRPNPTLFNNFTLNLMQEGYLINYLWLYGDCYRTIGVTSRFYLNFFPNKELIFEFVSMLKKHLDEAQIPFSLKFLSDPKLYLGKSDVCVLYIGRHHTLQTLMVLTRIYKYFKKKIFFCEKRPLFSAPIAKGVSFGEDPDDERFESFGSYRCAYITMSVFSLWCAKKEYSAANIIEEVNSFPKLEKEIPLSSNSKWTDCFYINKYSSYNYASELKYLDNNLRWQKKNFSTKIDNKPLFYDTALKIAHKLTSNAVWYESTILSKNEQYLECNWASHNNTIKSNTDESILLEIEYKTLDNSLTNGVLGVAYFLKMMYDFTEEYFREFDTTFYRSTKKLFYKRKKAYSNEEKWFIYNSKYYSKRWEKYNVKEINIPVSRPKNLKNLHLIKLIDKILIEPDCSIICSDCKEMKSFETLLNLFVEDDRSFEEILQTKEFKPSLDLGLSYIGYACLRLLDCKTFPPLPIKISYP